MLFACAISCCFLNACVPSLHSLLDTQHFPRKPIRQCWTPGSKLCKYPATDTGGPLSTFLYVVPACFIHQVPPNSSFHATACISPLPLFGPPFSQPLPCPQPFTHLFQCSLKVWTNLTCRFVLLRRVQKRKASQQTCLSSILCVSSSRNSGCFISMCEQLSRVPHKF